MKGGFQLTEKIANNIMELYKSMSANRNLVEEKCVQQGLTQIKTRWLTQ